MKSLSTLFIFFVCVWFSQATTYTVNVNTDVNTGLGAGAGLSGDLRYCIVQANTNPGSDIIQFTITPSGIATINLLATLIITDDVLLDGTSQLGYNPALPKPMIELKGIVATSFDAISINNVGTITTGTTIKGLIINNCGANGIIIRSSKNAIQGCYIGTNNAGTLAVPNTTSGIRIINAGQNLIGGTTAASKNVISGNKNHGIECSRSSDNIIIGNYIGTDVSGTISIQNLNHGISTVGSVSNNYRIGGLTSDSANVISGNKRVGINSDTISNCRIIGNLIGTTLTGSSPLGNGAEGITISHGSTTYIYGNTISCNSLGINFVKAGTGNSIKKNSIGVSSNGLLALGNKGNGIQIVQSGPTYGVITGPFIIGGNRLTEGNIISNNLGAGINLDPAANGTVIKGNIIGSDINGTASMGNSLFGVIAKSNNQIIGGSTNNEGNVIVGSGKTNAALGIALFMIGSNNSVVSGNLIGVGLDMITPIPNAAEGIMIASENVGETAMNNTVERNTIAYNLGNAINVGKAIAAKTLNQETGNLIRWNSIYCNVKKGIDLDLGDPADYGNNGKPTPDVDISHSGTGFIVGTSQPNDSIHIYALANSCTTCDNRPQGKTFLAAVKADASGNWVYPSTLGASNITVTATDAANNTSEFSTCLTLPITLISFKGTLSAANEAVLTWLTATEINNDKFILEKSTDGIAFTSIAEVKGAGNSASIKAYMYSDANVLDVPMYYRLKQVDYDGKYTYSATVAISAPNKTAVFIYPNPATDKISINIKGAGEEAYTIIVTDVLGRILQQQTAIYSGTIQLSVSDFAEGHYIVQVISESGTYKTIQKVVVIK